MPVWRNPAAWFWLAALAIPIAVHLLARVRARVIAFPSLRFIDGSRLAARKRRRLSDLLLLALRLLALLLAIAAFADPLFLTASRRAAWSSRMSRAVVIDTSPSMMRGDAYEDASRAAERESHEVVRAATAIRTESLPDGVARAVAWLRTCPPSRREIVVISDFQADTINAALLRDVPDDMGLRFIRVGRPAHEFDADARAVSTRGPTGFEWRRTQVHVGENTTALASRTAVLLPPIGIAPSDTGFTLTPFGVRISVADAERPVALATLQAVLAEGVPAPMHAQADRQIEIEIALVLAPTGSAPERAAAGMKPPNSLGPISAPWMPEVLARIATDRALADAIGGSANPEAAGAAAAPWRVVLADARGVPVLLAATQTRERDARELVLLARASASAPVTPLLFRAVLRALAGPDDLAEAEVRTLSDSALAAWRRPAAEPSMEALRNVEDSDRSWLWVAGLTVLFVETWVRRNQQRARSGPEKVEAHEHAA